MIVILPTGTGFLVGTLPAKTKNTTLPPVNVSVKTAALKPAKKNWFGVPQWMSKSKRVH